MTQTHDIVTEEMISEAIRIYRADERIDKCMGQVLRAVAPMIAARLLGPADPLTPAIVAAEREACAKIAERAAETALMTAANFRDKPDSRGMLLARSGEAASIAAAIRARGETP